MDIAQLTALPATSLLNLRVDALIRRCGLPETILDAADNSRRKHTVRWGDRTMNLSVEDWELTYGDRRRRDPRPAAWSNSTPGHSVCLSHLSGLVLHARGNSGILSVKKRPDRRGYVTTYRVPDNLYAAHLIVGLSGHWHADMPLSRLRERYGNPDEVLTDSSGAPLDRYWVVEKNKQQMPISLHAVDFEIGDDEKTCAGYRVYTSDVDFVQQKLDALLRQWEKDYVLD